MDALKIAATEFTPSVYFDPARGKLEIAGESVPENARVLYLPLIEKLDEYGKTAPEIFHVKFSFDYLNSLSLKYIYDIIKKAESFKEKGTKVSMTWDYMPDDDEMKENGEEFSRLVEVEFKILERK